MQIPYTQPREPRILKLLKFLLPGVRSYVEDLKTVDELTGLYKLRYFNEQLAVRFAEASSYRANNHRRARILVPDLSLLFGDLDRFHDFNRNNGQQAGHEALSRIGYVIRRNKRVNDVAGRLGGEEIGVLLPYTEYDEAMVAAKRFRQLVEEEMQGNVTISFGVATYSPQDTGIVSALELHDLAEKAMISAKDSGRNSVRGMYDMA
ncbi:MAG: GGDEF domain-containing protein [Candidatus Aenigmarchaeota archaeon]|nr:GGDEF domain-containing protein [Candidatus Aenigmarchaeota archaeon]